MLSPHLPALQVAAQQAPPLNPLILSGLFGVLALLAALGLTAALYRDRRHTEDTLRASKAKVEGYFYNVDRVCLPPTVQHAMAPRRSSRRLRRRLGMRSRA